MWYFLHLCNIKTNTMKSLNIIRSSNNVNIAIPAVIERSMDMAFNKERIDYHYDHGSRTR